MAKQPKQAAATKAVRASRPASKDTGGFVKTMPSRPANSRQAAEMKRLQDLADYEAQLEYDKQNPVAAKTRRAKERRAEKKIAALKVVVERGAFIPAHADAICEALSNGADLAKVLRGLDTTFATMCQWLRKNKEFALAFATAREAQTHLFISQIVTIADGAKGTGQLETLQINTRKWLASKLLSKLYGDKLVVQGDETAPLVTKLVNDSSELIKRIKGV